MKIVVICYDVYTAYHANKVFLMNDFESNGYEYEFWSLIDVRLKKNKMVYDDGRQTADNVYYLKSIPEVIGKIKSQSKEVIFIVGLFYNLRTLPIYQAALDKGLSVFEFDLQNGFYQFQLNKEFKKKRLLSKLTRPREVIKVLLNRLELWYMHQKCDLDAIVKFGTGEVHGDAMTSLSYGDYFDYELIKSQNSLIEGEYMVFNDNYVAYHPDFTSEGEASVNPELYFDQINSFFKKMEDTFNMPVVIAGHPRSNYADEFGERRVIRGQTGLLVRDASLVIMHYSSSIFYSCIYHKPMVFIFTQEFLQTSVTRDLYFRMKKSEHYFEAPLVEISTEMLENMPKAKSDRQDMFLKTYLTAMDYPLSNFELVHRYIQNNILE